jgi:hypothetical protein
MVSPELLRRYPFFGGLSMEEISLLAQMGEEWSARWGRAKFSAGRERQATISRHDQEISADQGK